MGSGRNTEYFCLDIDFCLTLTLIKTYFLLSEDKNLSDVYCGIRP